MLRSHRDPAFDANCEAAVALGPPWIPIASPDPMVGWHNVQTLLHQRGISSLGQA